MELRNGEVSYFYDKEDLPKIIGTGSGVIVSPNGYIITNNHVIENNTEIQISNNIYKLYYFSIIYVKFDFVINVSTIEEIKYPHTKIIENLLGMLKVGGFLIATFDLPGLQLEMVEKLFGRKIQLVSIPVTGRTSPYRMDQFDYLKVGYFVIQKLWKVETGDWGL